MNNPTTKVPPIDKNRLDIESDARAEEMVRGFALPSEQQGDSVAYGQRLSAAVMQARKLAQEVASMPGATAEQLARAQSLVEAVQRKVAAAMKEMEN
jgi:hypothetical protein